MKSFALAVLIAATTLVACSDEKAPQDPTAPVTSTTTVKTPRSASMNANASTVCKSYQKELASVDAQLQAGGSDELREAKGALESMTADACN